MGTLTVFDTTEALRVAEGELQRDPGESANVYLSPPPTLTCSRDNSYGPTARGGRNSARAQDKLQPIGEEGNAMRYAVITEAPGCHGEYSTVQRIVETGQRVTLTQREALHVIGEHADDPDLDWQPGQRIGGGLSQPEATGPIRGVFNGTRVV